MTIFLVEIFLFSYLILPFKIGTKINNIGINDIEISYAWNGNVEIVMEQLFYQVFDSLILSSFVCGLKLYKHKKKKNQLYT